jgi:hypothetical protein
VPIPTATTAPVPLVSQLPDPGRLWIRFAPRSWPAPPEPWSDFAGARLGTSRAGQGVTVAGALDDVLYLPPVAPELEPARLNSARQRLADGTPVLLQHAAGDPHATALAAAGSLADGLQRAGLEGATVVFDLLPALLAGELDALGCLPAGAITVWPLIAGISDQPQLWRQGCERLAAAGAAVVQALALSLTPVDRRRLLVGREEAFDSLFHGAGPSEREFARVAHGYRLAPFLPRPLPRQPLLGAGNRELAGALTLAADLWLRLGRPAGRGLDMARAAHWVDRSTYDVGALAREGNLGVVPEIDETTRGAIEGWAGDGRLELLDELLAEYTAPASGEAPSEETP